MNKKTDYFNKAIDLLKSVKFFTDKYQRLTIIQALKQMNYFENLLNQPNINHMLFQCMESFSYQRYKRGQIVYSGQKENKMYFILGGKIGIFSPTKSTRLFIWNGFIDRIHRQIKHKEILNYREEVNKIFQNEQIYLEPDKINKYFIELNSSDHFGQNCILSLTKTKSYISAIALEDSDLVCISYTCLQEIFKDVIEKVEFLQKILIQKFPDVKKLDLKQIALGFDEQLFRKSQMLYKENDHCTSYYIVKYGTVELRKEVVYNSLIEKQLQVFNKDDFFGFEDFFFNQEKRFFSAVCMTQPTILYVININQLDVDSDTMFIDQLKRLGLQQFMDQKNRINIMEKSQAYPNKQKVSIQNLMNQEPSIIRKSLNQNAFQHFSAINNSKLSSFLVSNLKTNEKIDFKIPIPMKKPFFDLTRLETTCNSFAKKPSDQTLLTSQNKLKKEISYKQFNLPPFPMVNSLVFTNNGGNVKLKPNVNSITNIKEQEEDEQENGVGNQKYEKKMIVSTSMGNLNAQNIEKQKQKHSSIIPPMSLRSRQLILRKINYDLAINEEYYQHFNPEDINLRNYKLKTKKPQQE